MKKQARKPSVSSGIILDITIKQSYFEIQIINANKGESKIPRIISFHQGGQTEIIIFSQVSAQNAELRDYDIRVADAKPGYTSKTALFYHGQFSEHNMPRAKKIQRLINYLNANAFRHDDRVDTTTSKNTIEITYTF